MQIAKTKQVGDRQVILQEKKNFKISKLNGKFVSQK